jgi:molecular chaperone DnaJ
MAAKDLYEKDLYKVLGVKKGDSGDAIKKQYRKLARELHPDKTKGDKKLEERFKEVSEAYEVLSDDKKRGEYDEMRNLFNSGQMPRGGMPGGGQGGYQGDYSQFFGGGQGFGGGTHSFDGGDIFSSLFGGGQRRPQKGPDYQVETHISFHDSIVGKELPLNFSANGTPINVKTRIAPGTKDGTKLRLSGRGGAGAGGNGDLYVTVHVDPHPVFSRKNDDLHITVPVTYKEAVMGANIKVPTFNGDLVTVKLAAGTPSGRTLRVKGKGVANGKHHGDLMVKVEIIVPQRVTPEASELLEKYSAIMDNHDLRDELIAKAQSH